MSDYTDIENQIIDRVYENIPLRSYQPLPLQPEDKLSYSVTQQIKENIRHQINKETREKVAEILRNKIDKEIYSTVGDEICDLLEKIQLQISENVGLEPYILIRSEVKGKVDANLVDAQVRSGVNAQQFKAQL